MLRLIFLPIFNIEFFLLLSTPTLKKWLSTARAYWVSLVKL